MRNKVSMDLLIFQSENGFSLDELVQKLLEAYENKAFSVLLRTILLLTQETLIYRILQGKENPMKCCSEGHLTLNGSFKRKIRTSLGEFSMPFVRVRCSKCGATFVPLQRFIGLERYQTKTLAHQTRFVSRNASEWRKHERLSSYRRCLGWCIGNRIAAGRLSDGFRTEKKRY